MKQMKRLAAVGLSGVLLSSLVSLHGLPANADDVGQGSIVSANPDDWTPDVLDGKVRQTATVGEITVAVGDFTKVRSRGSDTVLARSLIFAFDSQGQVSTTFVPQVSGKAVFDVIDSGDGSTVFIAGSFKNVNGAKRTGKIARVNVNTGQVVGSFKPPAFSSKITDIQLANNVLYVGGGFKRVGGASRTLLTELNPTTGADTGNLNLNFTGTWNGGTTQVTHMTVAPDGSRMVVIGNFTAVNGQTRNQIAMVDTSQKPAVLSSWSTALYSKKCSNSFNTYILDVDIDPTSTYFAIGTTGAYAGGPAAGTGCDTVARFELNRTGSNQEPTWLNYTGGDTVTQVEATGAAVYAGGHFRWMNNPYAADRRGPAAVGRKGLAALDPRNGMPFSWNPTRKRGWGVWGFRTSADGLWISHDTDILGGESLGRIAFMPLVGGTDLPADVTGSLPVQ